MAKIGPVNAPLIPTMILIAGGYVMWFAVHYWRDTAQVYPTGPVKAVLTGKGMPAPVREGSAADPGASALGIGDSEGTAADGLAGDLAAQGAGAAAAAGGAAIAGSGSGSYSGAAMESFWIANGGDPARAEYAAGVVNAESGGDPDATSSNPDGGTNVGLFQLDTKGVGSGHTIAELQDPTLNTQITIMATENGTNWSEWADPFVDAHGTAGNI
jgi:Lysozyme like domain